MSLKLATTLAAMLTIAITAPALANENTTTFLSENIVELTAHDMSEVRGMLAPILVRTGAIDWCSHCGPFAGGEAGPAISKTTLPAFFIGGPRRIPFKPGTVDPCQRCGSRGP